MLGSGHDVSYVARLGRLRALPRVVRYPRYVRRDGTMIITTAHDPNVWSGRASQENFSICRRCGLASMYPASAWSKVLRAIMDISAHAVSLAARPRSGPFGSPGFACAGKTGPPFRLILSQTSAGNYVIAFSLLAVVPLFVPSAVPLSRPTQRVGAARRGCQGWPLLRPPAGVGLDSPEHGATLRQVGMMLQRSARIRSCAPC